MGGCGSLYGNSVKSIDAGFAQQKAAKQKLRSELRGLIGSLSELEQALGAGGDEAA